MQASGRGAVNARLRGCGVGTVTAALAVAAHATTDEMPPDRSALLLLVAVSVALGACAARLGATRLGLLGLVGIGQLVGHLVLGATSMGAHPAAPPAMLAAHTAAVLVAVALVALAERAHPACTAALARVRPVRFSPLAVHVQTVPGPVWVTAPTIRQRLVRTSLARRGPPVGA